MYLCQQKDNAHGFCNQGVFLSAFLAKSRQAVKQVCNQFFHFCPKMFIEVF